MRKEEGTAPAGVCYTKYPGPLLKVDNPGVRYDTSRVDVEVRYRVRIDEEGRKVVVQGSTLHVGTMRKGREGSTPSRRVTTHDAQQDLPEDAACREPI